MSVTSIEKDMDNLTITLVADFDAPVEAVWELWADPRKLERWWGPPGYPATFQKHDLRPGGEISYYMTSPEGERSSGWWEITSVNPPKELTFNDGFADEHGARVPDMPVTAVHLNLTPQGDGTRMELRSVYDSAEDLEKIVELGGMEGLRQAVDQMDDLLVV